MGRRPSGCEFPAITLSSDQHAALDQWARSRSLPARVVERARIVLLAAAGQQDKHIAATMKITPKKERSGVAGSSPWAWQAWNAMRQ
jgi:hypothetical protein